MGMQCFLLREKEFSLTLSLCVCVCARACVCGGANVFVLVHTYICVTMHMLCVLVQNLSGRKMPHIHPNPKFFPQFMNNWKLVRDEMQALGMKTMGIEPEGTDMLPL